MIKIREKTLAQLCLSASRRYGGRTAFAMSGSGADCGKRTVTYTMMSFRARQIALLLRQLGVAEGSRVMLLAENCPEWPLAYFGIALAGAVSVPLLSGFSPDQVQNIACHAEVSAIITSRAMESKTACLPESLSSIPLIFLDGIGDTGKVSVSLGDGGKQKADCISQGTYPRTRYAGSLQGEVVDCIMPLPVPNESADVFPQRRQEDLASIIYTSGSTGSSKGVMLSGLNLISCAFASLSLVRIHPRDRLLSVLPLAHAYECSMGLLIPLLCGASVTYLDRPPSASVLLPAAQALRPTAMVTVPIFIEKMYQSSIAPKLQSSRVYQNRLTRSLAIRSAGRKLSKALGGRIRFFGIGGAPLSSEVENFLRHAHFPYAPGYGLTEASPLVAGTAPKRFPFRSSGAAPAGVEIRIAANDGAGSTAASVGEIQARGPNVMMGYFRNEQLTNEVFTADGWLRTGDLGRIDRKGKLYVCGRIKSVILGPSGENIYPEEIEGLLSSSQFIEEALVLSGEKGELIALVRLTDAAKAAASAAASAVEHVLEELKVWANKKLAKFSRIAKIVETSEPFEKTPTMKIKRHLYSQDHCRA